MSNYTKICCISDLHEQWNAVTIPKCDLLLVAGDLTYHGDLTKIREFNDWCARLQDDEIVKEIVVIAGNHDFTAQNANEAFRACLSEVTYLQDEAYEFNGLKIYGSPWQPWFHDWAFNAQRGEEIKQYWRKIPLDTDILITHGPVLGIGDKTKDGLAVGCADLLETIKVVRPKLFVCGHIHEGYGVYHTDFGTTIVNASTCTRSYKPTNPPIVITI